VIQQAAGRWARGRRRVSLHLMHLASDLVGDDWLGKRVRVALLRAFGAQIGPDSWFHGGTYFTEPRNLRVGADSFVNRNCYFDLEGPVTIGDQVVIGHGTSIVTTTHPIGPSERRAGHVFTGGPVGVGDGAWVGSNVTLLPGVSVGAGAVVAAGGVVTADVAPDLLVGGVPARTIRALATDLPDSRPVVLDADALRLEVEPGR
jgi:maltose O-acetyltransferase